jgi:hypothetical protein
VVFSEWGLGIGWCGGGVLWFMGFQQGFKDFIWGYGVFILFGDMKCSSFMWVFFENSA